MQVSVGADCLPCSSVEFPFFSPALLKPGRSGLGATRTRPKKRGPDGAPFNSTCWIRSLDLASELQGDYERQNDERLDKGETDQHRHKELALSSRVPAD